MNKLDKILKQLNAAHRRRMVELAFQEERTKQEVSDFFKKYPKAEEFRMDMAEIIHSNKAKTLLGAYRKAKSAA